MITSDTSLEWSGLFIAREILVPSEILVCLHLEDVFRVAGAVSQILDLPPRPHGTGIGCCL